MRRLSGVVLLLVMVATAFSAPQKLVQMKMSPNQGDQDRNLSNGLRETMVWLEDFEGDVSDWEYFDPSMAPYHWQIDDWEPFAGVNSWRCFNPNAGNPAIGGYENDWLDFMVSPAFMLPAGTTTAEFSFQFRAYLEDGNWDGANVWIGYGNDPGSLTWEVLTPSSPGYTENDPWAFETYFGDAVDYPAWAGEGTETFCTTWTAANFDFTAYAGYDVVHVGVAFASDSAYDSYNNTDMFGFQVDNLLIEVDGSTVWYEDADGGNIGGAPVFLNYADFFATAPITIDIFDDAALAYSPTHYLGVEAQPNGYQDQYALGPEFDMPVLEPDEQAWLDLYMNHDFEYANQFPEEIYWRPEIYNPQTGNWNPASTSGNYVYVGGTGGVWEAFSESGFTYDWEMTQYSGIEGLRIRIYYHTPVSPRTFDHFRIDDIFVTRTGEASPEISLNLIPHNTDVPTQGGFITHGVQIMSMMDMSYPDLTYWVDITTPTGMVIPMYRSVMFTLSPFQEINIGNVVNCVPGWAQDGDYLFTAFIGYPPEIFASDEFVFTKGGVGNGPAVAAWSYPQLDFSTGEVSQPDELPVKCVVSEAWPNPFNATASLQISLPLPSELHVSLYNVTGQLVATVAEGTYRAGRHSIEVDGALLSSGVYFVQVTVPGSISEMRKIVLIK